MAGHKIRQINRANFDTLWVSKFRPVLQRAGARAFSYPSMKARRPPARAAAKSEKKPRGGPPPSGLRRKLMEFPLKNFARHPEKNPGRAGGSILSPPPAARARRRFFFIYASRIREMIWNALSF